MASATPGRTFSGELRLKSVLSVDHTAPGRGERQHVTRAHVPAIGVRATGAEPAALDDGDRVPGLREVVRATRPDHATTHHNNLRHTPPSKHVSREPQATQTFTLACGSRLTQNEHHYFFGFGRVVYGSSSVRNGVAGSPSLLKKFRVGLEKFTQP